MIHFKKKHFRKMIRKMIIQTKIIFNKQLKKIKLYIVISIKMN